MASPEGSEEGSAREELLWAELYGAHTDTEIIKTQRAMRGQMGSTWEKKPGSRQQCLVMGQEAMDTS